MKSILLIGYVILMTTMIYAETSDGVSNDSLIIKTGGHYIHHCARISSWQELEFLGLDYYTKKWWPYVKDSISSPLSEVAFFQKTGYYDEARIVNCRNSVTKILTWSSVALGISGLVLLYVGSNKSLENRDHYIALAGGSMALSASIGIYAFWRGGTRVFPLHVAVRAAHEYNFSRK